MFPLGNVEKAVPSSRSTSNARSTPGGHGAGQPWRRRARRIGWSAGAGDQLTVEHGVDAEGGEGPQLGQAFADRSTPPGADLVAGRADPHDGTPSVELHFDGPVLESGRWSTVGGEHRRRKRGHRPQDARGEAGAPSSACSNLVAVVDRRQARAG